MKGKILSYFLGGFLCLEILYLHSDVAILRDKKCLKLRVFDRDLLNKNWYLKNKIRKLNVKDKLQEDKKNTVERKKPIEKATLDDLIKVKGIGKKTAEKIINKIKEKNGKVNECDILSIKGIGHKKLELLKKNFLIKPCLNDSEEKDKKTIVNKSNLFRKRKFVKDKTPSKK